MARDYDTQLLESVAVRRRRLREALLFGPERSRRTLDENITKILAGLCVAAVVCAGTLGWSFLRNQLDTQRKARAQQSQGPAPDTGAAPVPAEWVGVQVTLPMLQNALDQAQVPRDLYVLPGRQRPPADRTSSYYVLARGQNGFSVGIVEYRQGRTGAEFATEDEAYRWLYGELVVKENPPRALTPAQEAGLPGQSAALTADVRAKIAAGGGSTVTYPLTQGRLVDLFGQESGSTLFPAGVPFTGRGLPESARATVDPGVPSGYRRYRVARPFQVAASIPATGGAARLTVSPGLFPRPPVLPSVRWLLRNGYLERVTAPTVPR
ncbi:hypothetical protein DPM19_22050 [Actinomadura craniellae]|uniref:TNT domain-containing protein n=1 Tax=Actinomadura craniellae TaxID=2231787 RepID=A0A365H245_9ACTN|nr:TNT domain-containing protein [Actinomadura craniellae]RAY13175.1 hypothetical protein DPM19_22050 [Actinomadura craniellae]